MNPHPEATTCTMSAVIIDGGVRRGGPFGAEGVESLRSLPGRRPTVEGGFAVHGAAARSEGEKIGKHLLTNLLIWAQSTAAIFNNVR